ncbi:hypothetical protein [Nocardia jejuensis]|uniref:hypothetical protein n=1 Tax=Nocardia jejuensis TaxID=328049 RepID=UPI0008318058|nr:hypothetical protein [Nocardia jejuensis]
MYCLALVLAPPNHPDPVRFAETAMTPYLRDDRETRDDSRPDDPRPYDGFRIGWHDETGVLWRSRLGDLPAHHPVEGASDETRRVGDVDFDNRLFPIPSAVLTPDGRLHQVSPNFFPRVSEWHAARDLLTEDPDRILIPMACY